MLALGWAGLEVAVELVLVLPLYHSLQCPPPWLLSPDLIWDWSGDWHEDLLHYCCSALTGDF